MLRFLCKTRDNVCLRSQTNGNTFVGPPSIHPYLTYFAYNLKAISVLCSPGFLAHERRVACPMRSSRVEKDPSGCRHREK